MKREVLFKGMETSTGAWVDGYPSYSYHADTYYIGVQEIMTPVIPETICEYTGATDTKGIRIFEGDIIRTFHFTADKKDYYLKHYVKWDDSKHAFIAVSCASKQIETGNGTCFLYVLLKQQSPESVGNIHDHPELL